MLPTKSDASLSQSNNRWYIRVMTDHYYNNLIILKFLRVMWNLLSIFFFNKWKCISLEYNKYSNLYIKITTMYESLRITQLKMYHMRIAKANWKQCSFKP